MDFKKQPQIAVLKKVQTSKKKSDIIRFYQFLEYSKIRKTTNKTHMKLLCFRKFSNKSNLQKNKNISKIVETILNTKYSNK